jgi:hypothetical protein
MPMQSKPLSLPNPPTITSIISGDKQLTVYFTPGANGGSEILYFKYSLDQNNYFFTEQKTSPIIIKNLQNNTEYNVSLINANMLGESTASNIFTKKTNIIPPEVPIITEITPLNQSLEITFQEGSNNGSNIIKYYYSIDLHGVIYTECTPVNNKFTITNLNNGSSYNVRMKIENIAGLSQASMPMQSKPLSLPNPPTITSIISGDKQLTVYFTTGFNGGSEILYFKYSLDQNNYFFTEQKTSPIIIKNLQNNTEYNVSLINANMLGESTTSNIFTKKTNIIPPEVPIITGITQLNQSLEITFQEGSNNGSNIIKYYYSIDLHGVIYTECIPFNNKFTITNLNNGSSYNVRMKTENIAGLSQASMSMQSKPLSLPNPPTITSIISGDKQLTVYFTPGVNGGSEILYFKYSLDQNNYFFTEQKTSPIIIKNLQNNTEYNVSLINANILGESIASNIFTKKTNNIPPEVPIITDIVQFDSKSLLVVLQTDTYNSSNTYYYSINNAQYKESKIILNGNSLLITDLIPYNTYSVKIKAYNDELYSSESNIYTGKLNEIAPVPDIINVIPGDNRAIVYFASNNLNMVNVLYYQYTINNDTTVYFTEQTTSPLTIYNLTNDVVTTIKLRSVTTNSISNYSLPSSEFIPYGKPLAPSINKIIPGNGSLYVYLNDVSSNGTPVTSYEYFNSFEFMPIQGIESPLLIPNLTNGIRYKINLISNNKVGKSPLSNTLIGSPGTPTPPIITNVVAGDKSLTIYFTASNGNGSSIIQYHYKLNESLSTKISNLSSPFTINNLINGNSYSVSMTSTNLKGTSIDSNVITGLIPCSIPLKMLAPSLVIVPLSSNGVNSSANIYFTPPNPNGRPITGYKYKINGNSQEYNINSLTSPVTISELPINTNYQISITAVNSVGTGVFSANSETVIYKYGPPDKINITSAVMSFQTLTVNFTRPNLNGGVLQKYVYSLNNLSYVDYPNTTLPMVITGLSNNFNYNIKVKAVTNIGESIESLPLNTAVNFTYLSPNPPIINSIVGSNQTLTVHFTPSTIRGAPVTKYYYSFDGITLVQATSGLSSPITISNLTNNISYNVRLYADSNANISSRSNIVTGMPLYHAPSVPFITKIIPLNQSGLVYFNPPLSLNGSNIIDYVYSLNDDVTYNRFYSINSPFLISGLTNGIIYDVKIAALSDAGLSNYSQSIKFSPIYSVPFKPSITNITTTSNNATIYFNLSTPNGSPITKYLYTLNNGNTLVEITNATLSSNTGTFQLSPLIYENFTIINNQTYSIQIIAENDNGQSEKSNVKTFAFINTFPTKPTIGNISTTKDTATINFTLGSSNGSSITNLYYSINDQTYINANKLTSPILLTNLTSNITNTIKLKSENTSGLSDASLSKSFVCVNTVPSQPIIYTITTTKDSATLSFALGSANGTSITNLYYSINDQPYINANKIISPITLTGLTSNITNMIKLKSENALGLSQASLSKSFVCVNTVPSAPKIYNIYTTKNTANVEFRLGPSNGTPIKAIHYSLNDGEYIKLNQYISPIILTGLTSNVLTNIKIKAENNLGLSEASLASSFTCVNTVPSPPTIGTITTTKDTATVSFSYGSLNGTNIKNVYYSINGGAYINANKITSPIILTGLTSNVSTSITLKTENDSGLSNPSISKTFTCIRTVPSPPTITLIKSYENGASISFNESLPNGEPVKKYYYSIDGGNTYYETPTISSPFTINLSSYQTILLKMKAENDVGYSQESELKTFTNSTNTTIVS